MGVGGHLHAPSALHPGMTRYPLYRRLGEPQGRPGRVRKISPTPGFSSQSLNLLSYPDPLITIQYKPKKCNISKLIFLFIFNFWCLLHVSNSTVHLQEEGYIYSYDTGCFTCISVSGLLGGTVCSVLSTAPTTVFLKMELRARNM